MLKVQIESLMIAGLQQLCAVWVSKARNQIKLGMELIGRCSSECDYEQPGTEHSLVRNSATWLYSPE